MHAIFTEELTAEVSAADSQDRLLDILIRAARSMGFDHVALVYEHLPAQAGHHVLLIHDYPDSWARFYIDFELVGSDPILRAATRSLTGFAWQDIDGLVQMSRADRRMLAAGHDHGIGDGYTVPRHLPAQGSGSCSFVVRPGAQLPHEMLPAAEWIGAFALVAAQRLASPAASGKPPHLTERQRECVLWLARGKSAGEIAAILNISRETVSQHIKDARRRYGVYGRHAIILCALYDGVIGFSEILRWLRPA